MGNVWISCRPWISHVSKIKHIRDVRSGQRRPGVYKHKGDFKGSGSAEQYFRLTGELAS